MAIGKTGNGKTQLLASLSGCGEFKPSVSSRGTNDVKCVSVGDIMYIDTPGLGDSSGRDTTTLQKIAGACREIGGVNTIALVMSSASPRLDTGLQDAIKLYVELFGKRVLANMIIVFTRWQSTVEAERERLEEGVTKETRKRVIVDFLKSLQSDSGPSVDDIPCYFGDFKRYNNCVKEPDRDTLRELNNSVAAFPEYDLRSVIDVQTNIDAVTDAIARVTTRNTEEEKAHKEAQEAEQRKIKEAKAQKQRLADQHRKERERENKALKEAKKKEEDARKRQKKLEEVRKQDQDRLQKVQKYEQLKKMLLDLNRARLGDQNARMVCRAGGVRNAETLANVWWNVEHAFMELAMELNRLEQEGDHMVVSDHPLRGQNIETTHCRPPYSW